MTKMVWPYIVMALCSYGRLVRAHDDGPAVVVERVGLGVPLAVEVLDYIPI